MTLNTARKIGAKHFGLLINTTFINTQHLSTATVNFVAHSDAVHGAHTDLKKSLFFAAKNTKNDYNDGEHTRYPLGRQTARQYTAYAESNPQKFTPAHFLQSKHLFAAFTVLYSVYV